MTAAPARPRPSVAPTSPSRLIRTLTVTVFLQWMGATALVPMLPVYIRHLGGSDALAGVVMASFFAAGVVSQYPIGRLADRVGRRPVLVGRPGHLRRGQHLLPAPHHRRHGHRPPRPAGCSAPARPPWRRWP